MKNVLISVPNLGYVHKMCTITCLKLQMDSRYKLTFIFPSHVPFENSLHHVVNDFVKGTWDYWLSFDSDNPPINNPLDLIELDKDIIGLPTPVWHHTGKKNERPIYWNAYDYVEEEDAYGEHSDKKGLQKVDAVGTGCFIIAKRVFMNPEMRKGAFLRQFNPDGTVYKGNDISFCERATRQGFSIFAHYGYPCGHFNELDLNEITLAFKGLYG